MFFRKCFDLSGPNPAFFQRIYDSSGKLLVAVTFFLGVQMIQANPDDGQTEPSADVLDIMSEADRAEQQKQSEENSQAGETSESDANMDASSETEAETAEEVDTPEPKVAVDPRDSLVAVRGNQSVGLGILGLYEGSPVVVTSVSAIVGSRVILVTTPDGTEIPIVGVAAVRGRDLAFLAVGEGVPEIPTVEVDFGSEIDPKAEVSILNPKTDVPLTLGSPKDGRYPVDRLESPIFPGAPVLMGDTVIGVFSPARSLSQGQSSKDKNTQLWPAGVVGLQPPVQWEPIDLRTMAFEDETLAEAYLVLEQMGAFLGAGKSGVAVTMQPLLAAQRRLADGLSRANQEVEKERARSSFIFSVKSAVGSVESDLREAQLGFYSFFSPQITQLIEVYRPIREKISGFEGNPGSVDSFAR